MLYDAQRAVMRQVRWMHLGGYFVVLLFPLFMIALTIIYGGTVAGALRSNAAMIIGLPIFWLVGIPLLMRASAGRLLRNTPGLQGELAYTATEHGLEMQSEVAATQLAWSAFTKGLETSQFVLLFQSKQMATFLPKTAFSSADELDAFRRLVKEKLGARAEIQVKDPSASP
jgi:hypothetical protein